MRVHYRSAEWPERADEGEGGDEPCEGDEDGRPEEGRHHDPVRRNVILRADDTADLASARALGVEGRESIDSTTCVHYIEDRYIHKWHNQSNLIFIV